MLYQIRNGTVSVGGKEILSHIDFEVKEKEKIAIVGRNGAGKTTLLRLIAGELELDRDDRRMQKGIAVSRKISIGMLRQTQTMDADKTVDELLREGMPSFEPFSREQFEYETEYDRIFTGLGFELEQKKKRLGEFSGGEQTKIALIRLLLLAPDLLLLDEPTNHLDVRTTEWLESYLTDYPHAVVMVSHDRFFLDRVAQVVCDVSERGVRRYVGNYTEYLRQREKEQRIAARRYEEQMREIRRMEELIEKFKNRPNKAAFARSRKKMLERMERVPKPEPSGRAMFADPITPRVRGSKWVWEAEHLKVGYESALYELSMRLRRGQKIALIGENGCGKSTLLRTIIGKLPPLDGKSMLGNNIEYGYFDQQTASISSEETVYEYMQNRYPSLDGKDVRAILGAYLFPGKAASVKVSALSGGEKARLVLADLMTARPNLLLLDEPTNHMDIPAKESLEAAFGAYEGTMLFVSHDRYFIDQVADALLVIEDGEVFYYPFGYSHYLSRKRRAEQYGTEIAAQVSAEDQALLAGLRAVPKKERHETARPGTEEAYVEWRLGLMQEPLDAARDAVETAIKEREFAPDPEAWEAQTARVEALWENWTQACMQWFEEYEELCVPDEEPQRG